MYVWPKPVTGLLQASESPLSVKCWLHVAHSPLTSALSLPSRSSCLPPIMAELPLYPSCRPPPPGAPLKGGLLHLGPTNPRCPHLDACAADCATVPGEGSGCVGQRVPLLGLQIGCPPSPVFPEIWQCAWARCLPWFACGPVSRALDRTHAPVGSYTQRRPEGRGDSPPQSPVSSCPEGLLHPSWGQGSGSWALGQLDPRSHWGLDGCVSASRLASWVPPTGSGEWEAVFLDGAHLGTALPAAPQPCDVSWKRRNARPLATCPSG